jgi:hypothetical protein
MAQSVLRQAAQAADRSRTRRAARPWRIARRQAEVNDSRAVDNIRQALRAIDAVSDRKERDSPLLFIVEAQVQAGDVEGAWKSASAMSSDSFQDRAYSQIAKSQAWLGDIQGALEAAAMIHGSDFIERGFSPAHCQNSDVQGDKKGALAWATTQAAGSCLSALGSGGGISARKPSITSLNLRLLI